MIKYNVVFEQDGVHMHKEKSATFWFQVHDTPLIVYPPNSPDLNSIKPLSKILKWVIQYSADLLHFENAPHLAIQNAWDDLLIKATKH